MKQLALSEREQNKLNRLAVLRRAQELIATDEEEILIEAVVRALEEFDRPNVADEA